MENVWNEGMGYSRIQNLQKVSQRNPYYEILIYYVIASFVRVAWKVIEYRI
jgi:hypothetical protein